METLVLNKICEKCRYFLLIKKSTSVSATVFPCNACKNNPYLADHYTEEMIPCPFCGSEACIRTYEYDDTTNYSVACTEEDCGIEFGMFSTREEAIRRWNTRIK